MAQWAVGELSGRRDVFTSITCALHRRFLAIHFVKVKLRLAGYQQTALLIGWDRIPLHTVAKVTYAGGGTTVPVPPTPTWGPTSQPAMSCSDWLDINGQPFRLAYSAVRVGLYKPLPWLQCCIAMRYRTVQHGTHAVQCSTCRILGQGPPRRSSQQRTTPAISDAS